MTQVKIYALLLFCLAAIAQTAQAQATLSVQGVLKNADGSAVDNGNYSLTFKLYAFATGGTSIWDETQNNVAVTGGIYSALLGEGKPLDAPFDKTYYCGVAVNGGAELVPRARLTSSPYALSLVGKGNLFPSTGTIGAGTITPTMGYQLHVNNGSGEGKMKIEGTTAALIDFQKGTTSGRIGFEAANNNFVLNPGANNTALQYNGSTKLSVTTDGASVPGTLTAGTLSATTVTATTVNATTLTATNFSYSPATLAITSKLAVGQTSVDANNALKVVGKTYLQGFVEINGFASINYGNAKALFEFGLADGGGGTAGYSLRASHIISASAYIANSDRRIKKDFNLSDKKTDLSLLQKLRVTDYRHIDEVSKGRAFTKGFIAQEVKEIFPEAVQQSPDFIPDVFVLSSKTKLAAGQMTISLEKNHGFAVGDEVKLMLETGEKRVIVAAVPSENTFSTAWDETAAPEKIFVFGKKVKDFHTVDYDRIFTLNVSATQELARKVELLEKENAALKTENGAMKSENSQMKTEMKVSAEKFDARLRAVENRLSN